MSNTDWMAIMDRMAAEFQREAIASLRNTKKCFDEEGRGFDDEFKMYFFQLSNNSLAAAYAHFELELPLYGRNTDSATKWSNLTPTDNSIDSMDCSEVNANEDEKKSCALQTEMVEMSTRVSANGEIQATTTSPESADPVTVERAEFTSVQGKSNDTAPPFIKLIPINHLLATKTSATTSVKATAPKKVAKATKKHQCRFCKYSSRRRYHVERHERTHTGEQPYVCKRCNKAFSRPENLKAHEKLHVKKVAFNCSSCLKVFSQKTDQEAHVKVCKAHAISTRTRFLQQKLFAAKK